MGHQVHVGREGILGLNLPNRERAAAGVGEAESLSAGEVWRREEALVPRRAIGIAVSANVLEYQLDRRAGVEGAVGAYEVAVAVGRHSVWKERGEVVLELGGVYVREYLKADEEARREATSAVGGFSSSVLWSCAD